ncbi:helix-turn-helix domain-containing protein [Prauserella oleivorans]|uniref:Helix-turn-helix domain-containing protein n=1 Tax=Prauserella oleivorans TaxID=1478153 RepID=A0ABW5WEB1_9PSEU
MTRSIGYRWHLRELMAKAGMFSTTELQPHLADRGIELSASQVHRLVTGTPERLSLPVLAALCDILDCAPGDLVEPYVDARTGKVRKVAGQRVTPSAPRERGLRPTRARIVDRDET